MVALSFGGVIFIFGLLWFRFYEDFSPDKNFGDLWLVILFFGEKLNSTTLETTAFFIFLIGMQLHSQLKNGLNED